MKKDLVKTPAGIPIGEAVNTENGELGLEIKHGSISEIVSLKYLYEQVKMKVHRKNNKLEKL